MRTLTSAVLYCTLLAAYAAPVACCQGLEEPSTPSARHYRKAPKSEPVKLNIDVPPFFGPKKRLAVADMEIKFQATQTTVPTPQGGTQTTTTTTTVDLPPPTDFGTGMTDMLVTALSSTNRFILVERSDKGLQDMQKEQSLAGVNDQTRAQANKLLGASFIVRGAVTEYSFRKSSQGGALNVLKGALKGIDIGKANTAASVVLDIKVFNASTGEIIASEKADGLAQAAWSGITIDRTEFTFGSTSFSSSPLGHATRSAIEKAVRFICLAMEKVPWEGVIADVDAANGQVTRVYINRGRAAGVKAGDDLEIWTPGRVLYDPENPGRVLDKTEGKRIGRCRIEQVKEEVSIGTVVASEPGETIGANCLVRFPSVADGIPTPGRSGGPP